MSMVNSAVNLFQGTFTQILTAITCTLPMISDGMQYGWSAPVIPVFQAENSPIKVTKKQLELLESVYIIGAICGITVTIYLVDKIGRKMSLILAATTTLIVWIVIGTANRVEYIIAARFFTGMAGDMAFVAAPMYLAEIADQKIRGFLSSIIYLMMLVGIVVVYVTVPFTPYITTPILGVCINVIGIITYAFMPESPYYLLIKNKPEKAKEALIKFRQSKEVDKEFEEISQSVQREKSIKTKPWDIILVKSNRKAVLIMVVLNGAQHMACISIVIMNLHLILEAAGSIYIQTSYAAIIFSTIMLLSATISSFFMDRYGRKILLIISNILTGFCLLTLSIYFYLKHTGVDVLSVSWIPIVSVMIYAAAFKFGLGLVPIVLTAELFPSNVKALGMTLSDVMYVLFAYISIELYQFLSDNYGIHVPFFLFTACCVFTAAFTYLFIPETKGKTLEQIQVMLKGETNRVRNINRPEIVYTSVEKV
ncbi:unnamed protein product [Brassicogethes aeneus]|uniref:Major facilitator superfamily (MFS) profile domain-containing protein n=1 Tax=Brassicogethes aeneus TaxID=1431903 RepID=A0A9P0FG80_BRAAE|nr:unnamed protein product [Brassicogethes aeneus]